MLSHRLVTLVLENLDLGAGVKEAVTGQSTMADGWGGVGPGQVRLGWVGWGEVGSRRGYVKWGGVGPDRVNDFEGQEGELGPAEQLNTPEA